MKLFSSLFEKAHLVHKIDSLRTSLSEAFWTLAWTKNELAAMRKERDELIADRQLVQPIVDWAEKHHIFTGNRDAVEAELYDAVRAYHTALNAKTKIVELSVANDFSRFPTGRFVTDSQDSGERFRAMISKALSSGKDVRVSLDGTMGFGSSFLEEAFGGLVREEKFSAEDLHSMLTIISKDPSLESEVWSYIDAADEEMNR